MGMQTADDFHSATVAAACGGVTTIIDYTFSEPGASLMSGINSWIEKIPPTRYYRLWPACDNSRADATQHYGDGRCCCGGPYKFQNLHDGAWQIR
jgi:hypothetical protein